jgi:hypothetical protein
VNYICKKFANVAKLFSSSLTKRKGKLKLACCQGSLIFARKAKSLMDHLHWRRLLAKPSATVTRDSHGTVLALATLSVATQIGSFLFSSFGQGKYGSQDIMGVIVLNSAS